MKTLLYLLAAAAWLVLVGMARADDTDPEQNPARQKAVAWIKANNRFGIDAPMVTEMAEFIDKAVIAGKNYSLTFGENLLSGGSPVQIVSWDSQFLVIPLTAAQAREMDVKPSSNDFTTSQGGAKRESNPLAIVQSVKFDNASNVDGSQRLSGEFTCQIVGRLPDSTAVRVSYFSETGSRSCFAYPENLNGSGLVTVKFSVSPVNSSSDKKKYQGPLPVIVNLCTVKQQAANVEVRIVSNTIAELVTVSPPSPDNGSAPTGRLISPPPAPFAPPAAEAPRSGTDFAQEPARGAIQPAPFPVEFLAWKLGSQFNLAMVLSQRGKNTKVTQVLPFLHSRRSSL